MRLIKIDDIPIYVEILCDTLIKIMFRLADFQKDRMPSQTPVP